MIEEYLHLFNTSKDFRKSLSNYYEPWTSVTLEAGGDDIQSFKLGNDILCTFSGEYYGKKKIYRSSLNDDKEYILQPMSESGNSGHITGVSTFFMAMSRFSRNKSRPGK